MDCHILECLCTLREYEKNIEKIKGPSLGKNDRKTVTDIFKIRNSTFKIVKMSFMSVSITLPGHLHPSLSGYRFLWHTQN